VLSVACRERPTRMVGLACNVASRGKALTPSRVAHVLDGNKAMGVPMVSGRSCSQNSVRARWVALSNVLSRSSPVVVVNQAVKLGSGGATGCPDGTTCPEGV
jgi:hypothetical protein